MIKHLDRIPSKGEKMVQDFPASLNSALIEQSLCEVVDVQRGSLDTIAFCGCSEPIL